MISGNKMLNWFEEKEAIVKLALSLISTYIKFICYEK